jgi:outer membrane lipoprotein-sorting protein
MKKNCLIIICFGLTIISKAQTPKEIIARVQEAQQNIRSASYHVNRQDTLVTNDVRILSGDVAVEGLRFRVHQDGKENIRIFDGQLGYDLYPQTH